MAEPMSAERRAEIRAREQAASPAPWSVEPDTLFLRSEAEAIAMFDWMFQTEEERAQAVVDGEFSAHARTDVRDLLAEIDRLTTQFAIVEEFLGQRAQFVRTLRQCIDANADYHRWQGHAEARRVLAQLLGLPVAWPAEDAKQQDGGGDRG